MNYSAALLELYPDLKETEYELRDDGQGVYIARWDYSKAPKPNLSSLNTSAIYFGQYNNVITKRQREYPPIGEQLDALLKYVQELPGPHGSEIDAIIAKWQAVKTNNPLPTRS